MSSSTVSQWKISTKIQASFGLIIVILATLVAFSTYSTIHLGFVFGEYRLNAEQSNKTNAVLEDLLEARLDALRYRIEGSSEAAQGVVDNIAEIVDARDAIVEGATEERVIANIDAIVRSSERYAEQFERADAAQERRAERAERLDALGPATRREISAMLERVYRAADIEMLRASSRAQQSFLLGRLYASKFRIGGDDVNLRRAASELEDAIAHLDELETLADASSSLNADAVGEVLASIRTYAEALQELGEATAERDALFRDELDVIAPQIEALVEELVARSIENQQTLGPETQRSMERSAWIVALAGLACIVIALIAAVSIGRNVTNSISELVEDTTCLANGDLERRIRGVERSDEFGEMAAALEVFQRNLGEARARDEAQRREDETARERARAQARITETFEAEIANLLASVDRDMEEMKAANVRVQEVVDATSAQASAIESDAASSSRSVSTAAAAVTEMSASIDEISASMARAFDAVARATTNVDRTDEVVRSLQTTSERIGEVVSIINELAERTNMLALNATIESARAGEAGKGFAVVAGEVKELALQTSKSTDQIGEQIKTVQSIAGESVEAMASIKGAIESLEEMITAVSSSIEQQNAATSEIDKATDEASNSTSGVTEKIAAVARSAEETLAQSAEMKERVGRATTSVAELRDNVSRYLEDVAAV